MQKKSLFASDLDGVLLGTRAATQAFHDCWTALPEAERPLLCVASGRRLQDVQHALRMAGLPQPDYIISGLGTSIYDCGQRVVLKAFAQILEEEWDLEQVDRIVRELTHAEKKAPQHQGPYKSTWYWEAAAAEDVDTLRRRLDEAGLEAVVVYTKARDLDILPQHANKGNALEWLLRHLDIDSSRCIVAGDTAFDSSMFLIGNVRGILVDNAQPELVQAVLDREKFKAPSPATLGVLEGLQYYGVIDTIPEIHPTPEGVHPDPEIRHLVESETTESFSPEDIDYLRTAFDKAVEAVRLNITPMGFSACSLDHNTYRGTDENYRSVWARDGAITVTGTMGLEDPDIRQCQESTLRTLLSNGTRTGQIPSHVNIDSGQPDYSGVGNISSIDSALWTIIAFTGYIRKHRNVALLREFLEPLEKAMTWLMAQDSNHDNLLEIPEAGDWTDLFGRSYNVLYDEILWYRAVECYGRLMELLGRNTEAADFLGWSRTIKETILVKFWPSSKQGEPMACSFADLQFSLGDTQYLLAQVTPFNFSWRCDVYGNLLAYLYNVLDDERAKEAFRFMWGTGVNEPYPVANLYPVVTPGDSDWRPYYTVNLLNLPNHYHNGGLWPFIGGHWVRFLYRLGLPDIAFRELVKLANLNQLGMHGEWEFNEWAHGVTGHPMGKAYQAWSASEFIHAYHELNLHLL